jgi:hypothetical protein
VGVDPQGFIYAVYEGGFFHAHARVTKYSPLSFKPIGIIVVANFEGNGGPCCLRVRPDAKGAVWVGWGSYFFDDGREFGKYEPDQFTSDLRPADKNTDAVLSEESPFLEEAFPERNCPRPYPFNSEPECQLVGEAFNVDPDTNEVFALHELFTSNNAGTGESIITPYSEGRVGDPVHQTTVDFGAGKLHGSRGLEIDLAGNVWTSTKTDKIVEFSRGPALPTVLTKPAVVADIGHETATVRATIDPNGGGPITKCRVAWGPLSLVKAYNSPGSPASCKESLPYSATAPGEFSADMTGLTPGHKYRFRFEAENAAGESFGADRVVEARAVLKVETKPATAIGRNEGTLNGQLEPDGIPTEYWYEYGPTTQYSQATLDAEGKGISVSGQPGEIKSTPFTLSHLQSGHTYHYRLAARNSLGVTYGGDLTLRTGAPPEISAVGATHVGETSADVHAYIDPDDSTTTYKI